MTRSNAIVVSCMIVMMALLCALGTWQVFRLQWKEALIERVNKRLSDEPIALEAALRLISSIDLEYTPVIFSGTFTGECEVYEFTTHEGASGWNVFAPLQLTPGQNPGPEDLIMINRGFVPYDRRDQATRPSTIPTGETEVTGLLRMPLVAKPGSFVNENDIDAKTFFWRDIKAMASACSVDQVNLVPAYVDLGIPGAAGENDSLPIPGTSIVSFSNNHLQYALTWYGLALALLGVGSYFLYGRRNRIRTESKK
jgi:surfeit locus 1 family protein